MSKILRPIHIILGFVIIAAFLLPIAIGAQSGNLAWDETGTSLASVQGYTYTLYVNGVANGTVTATCTGTTAPFTCSTIVPTLPVGTNTITLTAKSGGIESAQSVPLNFPVPPAIPVNLRKQ